MLDLEPIAGENLAGRSALAGSVTLRLSMLFIHDSHTQVQKMDIQSNQVIGESGKRRGCMPLCREAVLGPAFTPGPGSGHP